MLKVSGSCSNNSVAYCSKGVDHICPRGFSKVTSGATGITSNDCSDVCPAGEICSSEYSGDCLAGRFCLSGTESKQQFASTPGFKITSTGAVD